METGRELLIRALVGDKLHLYQTSSSFHAAMNTLADMLPVWVEGFAGGARQADARMQSLIMGLRSPLAHDKFSLSSKGDALAKTEER